MTELELALLKMMTKPNVSFNGSEIGIGDHTRLLGQYLIFESLFNAIDRSQVSSALYSPDEFLHKIKDDIRQYYESRKYKTVEIKDESGKPVNILKSVFPVVEQTDVENISLLLNKEKEGGSSERISQFKSLLKFAFRSELIIRGGKLDDLPSFRDVAVNWYDSKYIALREIYLESDNASGEMALNAASFRAETIDASKRFEQFNEEFQKKTDALIAELGKLEQSHKDHEIKVDNFLADFDSKKIDFEGIKEDTINSIKNYERSVNEYLKTNILGEFWSNRAWWAAFSLVGSIFVIAALVALAGFGVYFFAPQIKKLITLGDLSIVEMFLLRENVSSMVSLQLTRAFLIAVPVVLYFWIMKLAIRFFMRSLLLMDDARQRNTIMQSYIQMVRDNAVDEKVLPIIMWALCRQVPGHGPDGIEPPDFSEVINAGLSFSKSANGRPS
ncbi:hypothetical protein [Brucella intermedia]|uniref:hypothetical protein n=1 Tax=Brucella intermedia TaxID=94625 RepID=UPI0007C7CAF3|nr:hypothetical protein [Brucella intermedia]OAE39736.1 hypothetical protein A7J42_14660 [Brucella intermedia]